PFTQAGAADEDRLGLRKRPRSALVDVAEGRAQQAPGGIAGKPAGFDGQGGTGSIGKAGMISGSIPGPGPSAARTAAIASRAGDGTAGLAAFRPADVLRVADALGRAPVVGGETLDGLRIGAAKHRGAATLDGRARAQHRDPEQRPDDPATSHSLAHSASLSSRCRASLAQASRGA